MTTLLQALQRLGLQQYHEAFVREGFDTWDTVLDIQESDLIALDVKLGHRRKLQRAIAESRGLASDRPLHSPKQDGCHDTFGADGAAQQNGNDKEASSSNKEQKRRYRRHPKPDINAPEKPPSAYVLFSNKVRDEVKLQSLSFTEIARLVGDRWQKLDPEEKSIFENRASDSKDEYNRLLTEYKKTDDFKRYVSYLADFRAKHGGQDSATTGDAKRPKLISDPHSSQDTDETQTDDYEGFQTRVEHDRAGSISSMSTISRSGTNPIMSLQVITSTPRMSAELSHRSPNSSETAHERRTSDRTPVQSYRKRETLDDMDTDSPNFVSTFRYDSPLSEASQPGQAISQERNVDGEPTPQPTRNQGQFHSPMYALARTSSVGTDLSLPPINPGTMPPPKPNAWEGYGPEGTRQPFSTVLPSLQPVAGSAQQSPRHSSIGKYSPITQFTNPSQAFSERTLPPIHHLSTTSSGYAGSSPGGFAPPIAGQPPSRPPPGSGEMAYRPGREQVNEPRSNVNVNANVGGSTKNMDSRKSPDQQSSAQRNQYAGSQQSINHYR